MTRTLHQQVHQFSINIDETHRLIALVKQKMNLTFSVFKTMHKSRWRKYRKIFCRRL